MKFEVSFCNIRFRRKWFIFMGFNYGIFLMCFVKLYFDFLNFNYEIYFKNYVKKNDWEYRD